MAQKAVPSDMNAVPDAAADLILRLLTFDLDKRLTKWDAIERHQFFEGIDWRDLVKVIITSSDISHIVNGYIVL